MRTHQRFAASPLALISSLWRNRGLIWRLTVREVVGRYRGSVLNIGWSLVNPLLMLAVYTFVFSVVFQARWGVDTEQNKLGFASILFIGLIVHGLFAECINRAPTLILTNVSYVKKIVFPIEILPWVAMGSSIFHALARVVVLMVVILLLNRFVPWTALLLPVLILPLVLLTMGVAWFLAATGVYLRDIGQVTGIITAIMLFMAPVFYPLSALPEKYRFIIQLNPLTFVIESARRVLIWGEPFSPSAWVVYSLISVAVASAGFWWFQRTRRGFADVL